MVEQPESDNYQILLGKWIRITGVVSYKNYGSASNTRYVSLYSASEITFFFDDLKQFQKIEEEQTVSLIGQFTGRSFIYGFTFEQAYLDQ